MTDIAYPGIDIAPGMQFAYAIMLIDSVCM